MGGREGGREGDRGKRSTLQSFGRAVGERERLRAHECDWKLCVLGAEAAKFTVIYCGSQERWRSERVDYNYYGRHTGHLKFHLRH